MGWGFEFDAVAGPLAIWQGGQDRMVPPGHGRWFAERMPWAQFEFRPGQGHISMYEHHYGEILDSLIVAGQAAR